MKRKTFIADMLGIFLVFGLVLTGCGSATGGDTDDSTGNGTSNPLLGAWRDSAGADNFLIFSSAVAYQLFPTKETALNTLDHEITLNRENTLIAEGKGKTYHYELKDGKLVIKESYVEDNNGNPVDLTLTRLEGSTKTGVNDLWYSAGLTTDDSFYTVLIIRSNTNEVWAAIGKNVGNNVDFKRRPYEIKDVDTAKPYVRWTDAAGGSTDFTLENNQLTMKWGEGDTTYSKITL